MEPPTGRGAAWWRSFGIALWLLIILEGARAATSAIWEVYQVDGYDEHRVDLSSFVCRNMLVPQG